MALTLLVDYLSLNPALLYLNVYPVASILLVLSLLALSKILYCSWKTLIPISFPKSLAMLPIPSKVRQKPMKQLNIDLIDNISIYLTPHYTLLFCLYGIVDAFLLLLVYYLLKSQMLNIVFYVLQDGALRSHEVEDLFSTAPEK